MLIGDSIRMGYQEVVRRELDGAAEVWAPGENGRTSRNVLERLEEWVLSRRPDLLHLNCGLHDIVHNAEGGATQISIDEYRSNLRGILDRTSGAGVPVIWASTTPVIDPRHAACKGFDRFDRDAVEYNEAAAEIVSERGIPTNDLYSLVMAAGCDELLSPDGVHFVPQGYEFLGKAVAEAIEQALAE